MIQYVHFPLQVCLAKLIIQKHLRLLKRLSPDRGRESPILLTLQMSDSLLVEKIRCQQQWPHSTSPTRWHHTEVILCWWCCKDAEVWGQNYGLRANGLRANGLRARETHIPPGRLPPIPYQREVNTWQP